MGWVKIHLPWCRIYASMKWSALVQIMAFACSAPSHCLTECSLIIKWTLKNKLRIKKQLFLFKKMRLKRSSAKWRPFCPEKDELKWTVLPWPPVCCCLQMNIQAMLRFVKMYVKWWYESNTLNQGLELGCCLWKFMRSWLCGLVGRAHKTYM